MKSTLKPSVDCAETRMVLGHDGLKDAGHGDVAESMRTLTCAKNTPTKNKDEGDRAPTPDVPKGKIVSTSSRVRGKVALVCSPDVASSVASSKTGACNSPTKMSPVAGGRNSAVDGSTESASAEIALEGADRASAMLPPPSQHKPNIIKSASTRMRGGKVALGEGLLLMVGAQEHEKVATDDACELQKDEASTSSPGHRRRLILFAANTTPKSRPRRSLRRESAPRRIKARVSSGIIIIAAAASDDGPMGGVGDHNDVGRMDGRGGISKLSTI
jgi:hypothetical protein